MNVRFFAGTRAQYDSLPAPHNPLGLYCCEDTKELFWGDRLLTDGMRVVPTIADLPEPTKAADGVVYYVTETRNGYVVPHGTTEWLQTIYAPALDISKVPEDELYNTATTVGAVRDVEAKIYGYIDERIANIEVGNTGSGVKAIYFAGKKLDSHDDGTFCIDRLCALRALGFVVPDDLSDEDKLDFVTKEYLDEQLAALAKTDLSDYAKKTDLEGLASETFVRDELAKIEIPDTSKFLTEIPSEYITESELNEKGFLTEHQSLEGYATEEFVLAKIAEAELNDKDVDLSAYYTKTEVDALIPEVPTRVSELENDTGYLTEHQSLDGYATEDFVRSAIAELDLDDKEVDLTNYATKDDIKNFISAEEVDAKIANIDIPSVEGLASTEYVDEKFAEIEIPSVPTKVSELENDAGYITEHQDLSEYAKLSDIPEIPESELYKVDFNVPDYTAAMEAYNSGKVLVLINAAPDINSYAIMNYVSANYITFTKFLMSRSETYGAFNTYYLKSDNTWEIAKEVKLNKVEANVEGESSAELASIRIGKEIYTIPSTEGYATEEFVKNAIAEAELNDKDVDLSGFATKDDITQIEAKIPSIAGLASEEFVVEEIAKIELPEAEIYKVDFNAPDFAKATEAYKAGKVLVLINAAPDTCSYALMNYVSDSYITFTKFLTNRSETYGAFNTYYLSVDNTWEVSKEVKISKVEANVEGEIAGQLTTIKINKEIYSLPSVEGLASEEFVNEAIASIEIPEVDLTGYATEKFVEDAVAGIEIPDAYDDSELRSLIDSKADTEHTHDQYLTEHQDISHLATKAELPDVSEFITSIPEEYITNDELESKGYLTEHQSLEGYATEEYVEELIEGIEIPETDLSEYSKTVDMNAAINAATIVKADEIPFTESKIVGKDVGLFKAGDDVKDLTIAQILAKLLELSDNNVTPEEPDVPVEPDSIVDTIILRQLPMYAVNTASELAEVPYNYIALTEENATSAPTESGFYQIKDAEGNVIESGYQELQVENGDVYYVIALPKDIDYNTMVRLQVYDTLRNIWTDTSLALTSDSTIVAERCGDIELDISHIDTSVYTVWVPVDDAASTSVPSGSKYRFVIIE